MSLKLQKIETCNPLFVYFNFPIWETRKWMVFIRYFTSHGLITNTPYSVGWYEVWTLYNRSVMKRPILKMTSLTKTSKSVTSLSGGSISGMVDVFWRVPDVWLFEFENSMLIICGSHSLLNSQSDRSFPGYYKINKWILILECSSLLVKAR